MSGPSFFNLANEPDGGVGYLLEDDFSSSHRGRQLVFVMLLVGIGVAGWHWRQQLRAQAARFIEHPAAATQPAQTTYASPASTAGSEVAGANPNAQIMTETQTTPENAPPATQPQPPQTSVPKENNSVVAEDVTQSVAENTSKNQDENATDKSQIDKKQAAKNNKRENTDEPKLQPVADDAAAAYEAEGEKYLYGTGVLQNCTHALQGLTLAAERTNVKADSVLGTMYATGHCVAPSTPTAYRWFSKAAHYDPNNPSIKRELKILWDRMTPSERRIATQNY